EKEIYESANSIIYRGKRKADNQKVILKQLRKEFPSPEEIARFKREYEMTGSIEYEGVVKTFGFSKYQNTFLMAIEDFGGDSIANYLITQHFTIEQFLPLAIRISEILSHIHSKKIIHKDINPSNIVWNSKTGQVKIIDFGISSDLSHETASPRHINSLEGTLNYISPEQTGRMNRVIDYRTDLYSLGATFYHMLTGKIPFTGNDSIEIVHSHIARDPIPPHIISKEIPEILSNIIIRLMAKTAENRYRSAIGLVHDLKWCLDASTTLSTRSMSGVGLQIGANDISDRFEIPQKLYGREKEVETLLNAFARINDDSKEIVLVSGYSGMGKSSVVQEIYKPIIERKGIFIQGKFDQFKRNIPYSSIIQAFRGLVQQILTESKEDLLIRKKQILNVLGQNCSIIIDVIPEVELITGEQPHAPVLSMEESKNRFNLVFRNFVRIFTSGKSPLAIFFDDLQWADLPSLQLLELILTDTEIGNLFVIGAYRDNEVDPTHPLITTLRDIENKNTTVNTITLSPLKLEHVEQLISDTIHLPQSETGSLASLCFEKTQGNPFFLNQFLKILYKESLVVFDSNLLHWKWEIAEIKKRGVTDNVVDLMTNKIKKLSFHTQKVLRLGACIGNRFDLKTLAIVNEKSLTKTAFELYEALKEGLIIPLTETYNLVGQEIEGVGFESIVPEYKFSHDRVQQAAYLLISEEDRKKVHLSVGRLLLEKSGSQSREEDLFNIVNHLNLGIDFITDESEKIKLIELNLSVSKKAKLSAAYEPAYNYAKSAMSLLPEEVWKNDLKLAVKVYLEVGETAFLSGNFDSMENILDTLLENEIELVDKAKAYEIKMHSLTAMHNSLGTVKMSLQILKLLGIDIPENPGQEEIGKELGVTMEALSKFKINELLDLPEMKDNEKIAALRILEATFSPCFQTNPALFPILVFKMTQLSLIYGNAKNSPQAYACYGLILCGIVGDIDSGYQFGQLAIKLIDKLKAEEHKPNTMYLVTIFITHWKEPLKNTIEPYWKAYQLGLIVGDFEYAAWSAMFYNINSFFVGKDLLKITEETLKLKNIIQEIKQETTLKQILMFHQFLLNLIGDNEKPWILIGESYNEDKMHPLNLEAKDNSSLFLNYFYKVFICLLLDETQLGIENLEEVGKYLGAMPSTYFVPQFHFYESLLKLKLYPEILNEEKEAILNKVNENQTKMKTWSDHCSENYLHKFYLVEAEKARVLGKNWEAVEFYDKAVKLSKQNDFLQEEALANELFANFWLFQDKKEMGQILINNSYYLYSLWGAKIKTTLMEKKYGHLISKKGKSAKFNTLTRNSTISTINDDSGNLDFVSVLKASQTISGEIVVDELLKKMMSVVIENAGAETGLLLQEKNGEWNILAKGEANKEYMEKSGVNHLVPLSI
ncbi:MAG: serine/threonine-protein kinase PknK, partial [Leptospiraceae bacterium]|nr:serine/threonine-protein kinase PknK [Leptospiraceae bacterium]